MCRSNEAVAAASAPTPKAAHGAAQEAAPSAGAGGALRVSSESVEVLGNTGCPSNSSACKIPKRKFAAAGPAPQ